MTADCRCPSPSPRRETWERTPGHIYCAECGTILVNAADLDD